MIELNGIIWHIVFVPPYDMVLRRGDGSITIGMCDANTRIIYINQELKGALLKKVLCHELTHAAMFSYGVTLTVDQEELVADLLATYGEEVIEKTNLIFNKLKGVH